MNHNHPKETLEGASGHDGLHEEILAEGGDRFPEESFQQLLSIGVSPREAVEILGFSPHQALETELERQQLRKLKD